MNNFYDLLSFVKGRTKSYALVRYNPWRNVPPEEMP